MTAPEHPVSLFLTMEGESVDAVAGRLLDLANHLSAGGTGRITFGGGGTRGQLDVMDLSIREAAS